MTRTTSGLSLTLGLLLSVANSGCVAPAGSGVTAADYASFRRIATETVETGLTYRNNPAVRVGAIEAMEAIPGETKLPWLRAALLDDHPAVRFAACVALGKSRDAVAARAIGRLVDDPDENVRVAAYFARHRLGDSSMTGKLATDLLNNKDPGVRRNAAFVLGLLDEPGSIAILARAVSDKDPGVRMHALEAMAKLGSKEAKQELTFQANSGIGADETFAVLALGETRDRRLIDTFRYKLINAAHLETQLAAARGLGLLGYDDGLKIALKAISSNARRIRDRDDPQSDQVLRARQLGAFALGAIGQTEPLPKIVRLLKAEVDPRVQITLARAILETLSAHRERQLPFLRTGKPTRMSN